MLPLPGVEKVVEAVLILHDGAGADRGVGIRQLAKIQNLPVIFIGTQVLGGIFVDGVISHAIVIRVIEVIELERAVIGHEGHRVTDVCILRRGIEIVIDRGVWFVRKLLRLACSQAAG